MAFKLTGLKLPEPIPLRREETSLMRALPEKKRELIEDLVHRAQELSKSRGDDDWSMAEPFIRYCFEEVGLDELKDVGIDDLVKIAISLFGRFRKRPLDDIDIRLFNPGDEGMEWGSDRTVIEVVSDDMPFLVGSVTGEISRRKLTIYLAVHPQLACRRDDDGQLKEVVPLGTEGTGIIQESVMHFQVDKQTSQADLVELETALRKVLNDVRMSVSDWRPMHDAGTQSIEDLKRQRKNLDHEELDETVEFMEWVVADHFTFLGYIEYDLIADDDNEFLRPDRESGLGLLRHLPLQEMASSRLPVSEDARRFLHGNRLVLVSKSTHKSTVHRIVHMDVISLKRFDDQGQVNGEVRFVGLFTSMAYSIASRNIPLVRRKVQWVMENTRFLPSSHDAKVLRHIVEHYPRDELFQISKEDLYRFSMRILELQLRPRLALLLRRDEDERFVSCLVFVPRERHNTQVRERIQAILQDALQGEVSAYSTRISERPLAQLHLIVQTRPGHLTNYDPEALEKELDAATQSWSDRLGQLMIDSSGSIEGQKQWRRYEDSFPGAYQQHNVAQDALDDIPHIENTLQTGELGLRLYRRAAAAADRFHLRTFELAVPRPLSELLPILENMGLRVVSEYPFEVRPADASNPVWIRDFEVSAAEDIDLNEAGSLFKEALRRVFVGDAENDGFNRLVLQAELGWRKVVVLRAYCKYLRQTGIAFSQAYMAQTLAANADVVGHLLNLFFELFDPSHQDGVDREQLILGEIHQALDSVQSLDQDRILRRFLNLVQSTLRTNFFQTDADGKEKSYVSFKFDAQNIIELPRPRPIYEIFVYSPRMEAVHLRGGKVARGGIRWSDRLEDFRTEILGLVKSQMVKNAVIVPVGAKGGFIVKQPPPPGDREAWLAEGVACYQTMIRGLLDITDNLVGGKLVPAEQVVRRDADDPYLVVAADKGTATFSDIANGVAAEYNFWLGDAFASGGSVGYDHKKMGITARGAWESVKRHFREMGRDIQHEAFTCVGVGDMAGDVFGNGMLRSEHTRLVAAFNHLHIFVDPNPPASMSFAERQRLFALPRSTWDDYKRDLLSEGGDIFDRHAKRLTVSPEVKERFGLPTTTLTPNELIQAILRAKVDLLWFGGIGTYIKASDETHADAGDRSNDEVRVSADELGCLVLGEGANLGVTQRGRIELGLRGGRLNTDFIDNSGGVDCSDHEVNIKIALREAVLAGDLTLDKRDALLASMTDEVARLVLQDNYLQSQAISLEQTQGHTLVDDQARLMRLLERMEQLDRRLEFLPDDSTLAERKESNIGLTRPEIAVLFAYAKIFVYNHLLDSDLPDDPLLEQDLLRYFPKPMRKSYASHIAEHRLRREIIATHVTNSIVNRMGTTFATRLRDETGRRVSEIARAYIAARDVFEMRTIWETIESLDNNVSADEQHRMLHIVMRTIADVARWFLRYSGHPFDLGACLEKYESGMVVVAAQLEDLLPPNLKAKVKRRYRRLRDHGVPEDPAMRIAGMDILPFSCDVARTAHESGEAVERVGMVYFAVGERFGFDRLRRAGEQLKDEGPYMQAAVTAVLDDLSTHQSEITRQVVVYPGRANAAIKSWVGERHDAVARLEQMRGDFDASPRIDIAMLTIAERELRRVVSLGSKT